MINTKQILDDFNGVVPIFPLPDFVMYPKTAYNFNIFESRYKDLVSDVLSSNRLFCTSLLKPSSDIQNVDSLDFYSIGNLCYIAEYDKLDNGNYNIMVSGLKKIKIKNELDSDKNYRIVDVDIYNDNDFVDREQEKRKKIVNKFTSLFSFQDEAMDLKSIDTSMIPIEMLTNLGSLILPLESIDKQKLLELDSIELRLEVLCQFMDSELKVESDLNRFNNIIPTNINWN